MELTVQIPDDVARSMSASGDDLPRRALEALAIEEFKSGRITKPELGGCSVMEPGTSSMGS